MKPLVLIVEDHLDSHSLILEALKDQYEVMSVYSATEVLAMYDVICTKVRVLLLSLSIHEPNQTGLDFVRTLRSISPLPEIVVLSDLRDIQLAISAVKEGVFDFIPKPLSAEVVQHSVENALQNVNFLQKLEDVSRRMVFEQADLDVHLALTQDLLLKRRIEGKVMTVDDLFKTLYFGNKGSEFSAEQAKETLKQVIPDLLLETQTAKILIVEDDRDVSENIREFLSGSYGVYQAYSGAQALTLLKDTTFDLVLLDIYLPDTTGVKLLGEIKAQQPLLDVIIITAYKEISVAVQTLREGACDYLNKPFFESDLLSTVSKVLQRRYFERVLPEISRRLLEEEMPKKSKMLLLQNLCDDRSLQHKKIFMQDIYALFPELRQSGYPEGFQIPATLLGEGIQGFVQNLLDQLKPENE